MKLTFFFLVIVVLNASATGQKVTLDVRNVSLEKIFREIRKQTGYVFFYEAGLLQKRDKLSLVVKDAGIDEVLKKCLDGLYQYSIIDNTIVIKEKMVDANKEIAPPPFIDISGVIKDEKGGPLEGVSVLVKGKKRGTSTKQDGSFHINANEGDLLEISAIGFKKQTVPVGKELSISIIMQVEITAGNEVVVIGYGTQRKSNITGSIATVSKESLANRPLTNASQALQGVSGVYVNQGSGGQPGADDATIRIRGVGTLNNNDPLVLVDGISYNLHDINPNDIESISVLKDAAAASIYGNRAANGVILIKTKSGARGKMTINYDNSFGWQQATYLPDLITNSADEAKLFNQALANQGVVLNPGVNSFSQAQIDSFAANYGKQSNLYPSTNWFDVTLHKAFMQQHNLRFSGGTDKTVYSVSAGYQNQDGILIGTNAKKYSLASNLTVDISPKLKFGFNLNMVYWDQNQSPTGTSGMFNTIYRMRPEFNVTLANGNYADNYLPTGLLNGQNSFRNPYVMAINGMNRTTSSDVLANIFAEYTLPFNIKYKADFGVTKADSYQKIFTPNTLLYNPVTGAANPLDWGGIASSQPKSAERINSNSLNTTFYHTLSWNGKLNGGHNIDLLLGNSFEDYLTSASDAYIEGIIDNNVTELSNGTINQKLSSSTAENKLISAFGRAGYSFNEKYLAEFDFRYDGSSRFAPGKRWGFFPAASVGWRIDKEKFFADIQKTIPTLKLRGSWGQLGNQNIANFAYTPSYTNTVTQGYNFGTTYVVGAAATSLPNPDISWERTTITDIGLEAGLLNNKLSVTFDYFNRLTTDILAPVIIPSQVGNLTGPTANLYSIRNTGVELGLGYKNNAGKLGYAVSGNISYVNNKVVSLKGLQQISGVNIIKEGYSVNAFYLLQATGIFEDSTSILKHVFEGKKTAPGDLAYQNQDGDTAITGNDRIVTGRSIPSYTYTFNVNLNYGRFDFAVFLQGVAQVNTYLTLNLSQPFYNGASATKDWLTDAWTPSNPGATLPRVTTANGYTQNFQGIAGSTFWLKDASYLRVKNIQLGYTIPSAALAKAGISKLRVFVNAQNMFTFSKLKLTDPERVNTAVNIYSYPTVKIFTGGISLNF